MALVKGIVFDMDGVLLHGSKVVPGAGRTLDECRRRGYRFTVCTNENYETPAWVERKLVALGLPVEAGEVVTAGRVAAEVIAKQCAGQKVLVMGGPGLEEPLRAAGIELVEPAAAARAQAVVIGSDPLFSAVRLDAACQAVWNGARFFATSDDPKRPLEDGFEPGTGPFVWAVAHATGTKPTILAKPSRWAADSCLRTLGLPAADVVMVGDQYQQDIAMGKAAGMRTVLLLSGSTTQDDLPRIPPELQPDAILPDVTHVPAWLASAGDD